MEERAARWLGAGRVTMGGGPTSGGWSNETIFAVADDQELVLRIAPAGAAMFPDYDLSRQVSCLRHVHGGGLPAPEVVATDLDGTVFGRPMFAMSRIPGRVPADSRPNFARAGFLHDATPDQQRRFSESLVDVVADLHGLPLPDFSLPGPDVGSHLAWCDALRPEGPTADHFLDEVRDHLARRMPEPVAPAALLWGDARAANTIVDDDFDVCGLLDWELAATGAAELDLAWMAEMDRMRAPEGRSPALPGFLSEEAVEARWQHRTGRCLDPDPWYRLYAAFKIAVLLELHLAAGRDQQSGDRVDVVPPANRARRRLRELLPA